MTGPLRKNKNVTGKDKFKVHRYSLLFERPTFCIIRKVVDVFTNYAPCSMIVLAAILIAGYNDEMMRWRILYSQIGGAKKKRAHFLTNGFE